MMKTNLPVLFLKNHEIFPYSETKLEFDDVNLKKTISLAENLFENCLVVVHQRQGEKPENYNNINVGIIAKVNMKIDMPNGNMRITLKGLERCIIQTIKEEDMVYEADIIIEEKKELDPIREIAMARTLRKSLEKYIQVVDTNAFDNIRDIHDIDKLTDIIVNILELKHNRKLKYLKEIDPVARLGMLLDDIEYEISARSGYLKSLKDDIKRLQKAMTYYNKIQHTSKSEKKQYYKEKWS